MNNISFNSKMVKRGIPSGSESSNDRIPTRDEITEMLKYPDRRLKPITYTMISSGIRVGSWEYLQWKHVIPKEREGNIVAAKLIVTNTKINNRTYYTFISPEAYHALKEWMDFRSSQGETITGESWLMRDLWNTNAGGVIHRSLPRPNSDTIRMILNRAWKVQNVRIATLDMNSKKKYEFKATHSFRKYFETHALKYMMILHVKMLMDHDIGVDKSYLKSTEDEILDDYLKVVDLLTITQIKTTDTIENNKDEIILNLTKKMEKMESDFSKVLQVVDISKLRTKSGNRNV
jgi:integrase